MKFRSLFLILCIGSVLPVACSESSTEPGGDDNHDDAPPRAGSSWVFARFTADTSGAPVAGTVDTTAIVLSAVGLALEGKSGVNLFTAGADTMPLLRYESNGDLEWFPPFSHLLNIGWIVLPVGTRGSTTKTLRDTMIDVGGGQMARSSVILTVNHEATEDVAVGNVRLPSEKVRVQVVTTSPITVEQNLVETESVTLWYSTRAGYFVREERRRSTESPIGTERFPTGVAQLISYELK